MFFISNIIDGYYTLRLKSKPFREHCYKKVIGRELRHGRLNIALLRNLNKVMADNQAFHDEFRVLVGDADYQQVFWESDLGYLWYKGNLNRQNVYFNYALEQITANQYASLLDVGCGWGEFPARAFKLGDNLKIKGIDVSEDVILQAKKLYPQCAHIFECRNVLDIEEKYDLVTLFGSTDYIDPSDIYRILEKIIRIANKQILIVNSLRQLPFEKAVELTDSKEIRRYDVGYVHPLKKHLDNLKLKYNFKYELQKAGQDSVLAVINL